MQKENVFKSLKNNLKAIKSRKKKKKEEKTYVEKIIFQV